MTTSIKEILNARILTFNSDDVRKSGNNSYEAQGMLLSDKRVSIQSVIRISKINGKLKGSISSFEK